jgi:hypothetical protein
MKIRYVYGLLKEIEVESDFVPIVGDYVSLTGCTGVSSNLQTKTMKVVARTFSCQSNSVIVSIGEV